MTETTPPFDGLTPDRVISAVESLGLICDLRITALNSYENRVYQVGIDGELPIIAKFYRPARWSDAQILEEHAFSAELQALEIPAISPLSYPVNSVNGEGKTLHLFEGFRFSLYPRVGGGAPEFDNPDHLNMIGRTLGRLHLAGVQRPFEYRQTLSIERFACESIDFLLSHDFLPPELRQSYETLTADLLIRMRNRWEMAGQFAWLRTHGDCHVGNILWRNDTPFLVDFDDCMMAPAVQDLWLFLSGTREEMQMQLSELLDGYGDFMDFNPAELHLVEVMRTLRIIHYSAWLARRWNDPAFPHHFPWFNTGRYWAEHILELREQLAALDEPALRIF
ncbi:MAG: serine/threonine protein kinase [Hahellaceae bacterium]|nr:serine/threonine protein kinase [Hahellaceae bacterium]MCP5169745.1 serine/threonine protein kinase [Hahellaceae bacterium]